MDNIKKVGLTALAGSLAAVSANAAEMTVSGATVLTYTSEDGANGNGKTLTRSCHNCADWSEAVSSPGTI